MKIRAKPNHPRIALAYDPLASVISISLELDPKRVMKQAITPTAATPSHCPPSPRLRAYLDGQLLSDESQFVEEHVEICAVCESQIQSLLMAETAILPLSPSTKVAEDLVNPVTPAIDQYESLSLLDSGGFGIVWKMRDLKFNRLVAVKVMKRRVAASGEMVRRFLAEAQIGSQLSHPFIVPVHDMGVLADGRGYCVMKLVEGERLDRHFAGPVHAVDDVMPRIQAFANVCQAMGYAHDKRVIHRDLKPQNVMVGGHGEIQVMDWGLAKVLDAESMNVESLSGDVSDDARDFSAGPTWRRKDDQTADGAVGTFAYMPPEQVVNGAAANFRSDVFSLGGILCCLLTGQPPYPVGDRSSMELSARAANLENTHRRLEDCPIDPRFVALTKLCLSADPTNRPANAAQVSSMLQALLADIERELQNERVENARQKLQTIEDRKRRRLWMALATTALITLIVVTGVMVSNHFAREIRVAQSRELLQRVETSLRDGDFDAAEMQLTLASELMPAEDAETREDRRRQIELCVDLEEIFQQQATTSPFVFNGQIISETVRDTAITRAIDAYQTLLPDAAVAAENFWDSPGRAWLAAALANRAWLHYELGSPPSESIESLLELAVKLDNPTPINQLIYDSRNWSTPTLVAERLTNEIESASPGALQIAIEILLQGDGNLTTINALVARRPDQFWLNLRWGTVLGQRGETSALRFCQAAVALRPDDAAARLGLGTVLANRGDFSDALAEYDRALAVDPSNATLHNNRGTVLRDLDRNEEAIASFQIAIACNQIPEYILPLVNWGNLLRQQGNIEEAMLKFDEAIGRSPQSAYAHYHKAMTLDEQGEWSSAIELYERALSLNPDYSFAHNNLGKSRMSLAIDHRREGNMAAAEDIVAQAQQDFRAAINADPTNAWAFVNLGNTCDDQGDIDEAVEHFKTALQIDPDHPAARFNLANTLLNARRYAESEVQARELLRSQPDNSSAHFILGLALAQLGHNAESCEVLKRSIELAESQASSAESQKQVLAKVQPLVGLEDRMAASIAEQAVAYADPIDAAELFAAKRMFATASEILQRGISSDPELGIPKYLFRAANYSARAGESAPDEIQREKHLTQSAQFFSDALTALEQDADHENSSTDVRRAASDEQLLSVRVDQLPQLPDSVAQLWRDNWIRVDSILNSSTTPIQNTADSLPE